MREVPCILNLMTTGLDTSLHRPGWDFWETSAKSTDCSRSPRSPESPKHPSGATEKGSGEAPELLPLDLCCTYLFWRNQSTLVRFTTCNPYGIWSPTRPGTLRGGEGLGSRVSQLPLEKKPGSRSQEAGAQPSSLPCYATLGFPVGRSELRRAALLGSRREKMESVMGCPLKKLQLRVGVDDHHVSMKKLKSIVGD